MFDIGVPMVDEAFARNPILPGHFRIGPYLARYAAGDYEQALIEARRVGIPDTVFGHITLAMAYARLGKVDEAAAAVDRILAIDPTYGDHVHQDLAKRNLHPELIEAVADGLRLAGLAVAAAPRPTSY
jgi:tetratricopeptide (TPR) repeat protein